MMAGFRLATVLCLGFLVPTVGVSPALSLNSTCFVCLCSGAIFLQLTGFELLAVMSQILLVPAAGSALASYTCT